MKRAEAERIAREAVARGEADEAEKRKRAEAERLAREKIATDAQIATERKDGNKTAKEKNEFNNERENFYTITEPDDDNSDCDDLGSRIKINPDKGLNVRLGPRRIVQL